MYIYIYIYMLCFLSLYFFKVLHFIYDILDYIILYHNFMLKKES